MRPWFLVMLAACANPMQGFAPPDTGFIGDDLPPDAFFISVDSEPQTFCAGQPLPTKAADPLAVTGTSDELIDLGLFAESGVTVNAYLAGDTTARATMISDAQGAFSLSVPTGGTAQIGYFLATHTGFLPTYAYPAVPFSMDIPKATAVVVTAQTLSGLASTAQTTQDPARGVVVVVRVVDCVDDPVAGAQLNGAIGTVVYAVQGMPSTTATSTDASGLAYIFDVPAGDVTIAGTYTDIILRAHVVQAYAGALTMTELQP